MDPKTPFKCHRTRQLQVSDQYQRVRLATFISIPPTSQVYHGHSARVLVACTSTDLLTHAFPRLVRFPLGRRRSPRTIGVIQGTRRICRNQVTSYTVPILHPPTSPEVFRRRSVLSRAIRHFREPVLLHSPHRPTPQIRRTSTSSAAR
jgi:hypothetical protein